MLDKEAQDVLDNLTEYYIQRISQRIDVPADTVSITYEEDVGIVKIKGKEFQGIGIMDKEEALQALLPGEEPDTQSRLHVLLKWNHEVPEEMDFETETKQDSILPLFH
jgi:hypothetical protein